MEVAAFLVVELKRCEKILLLFKWFPFLRLIRVPVEVFAKVFQ